MTALRLNIDWRPYLPAVIALLVGFAPAAFGAGKTIAVDGINAEWDAGDLLYADAEISDGTPANSSYANVYVANDTNNLYFGLETKGSNGATITNLWSHFIYLDTDTNGATGYNGGIWSGGYDRQVRYGDDGFDFDVYQFTGGINQSSPSWGYLSFVTYAFSDSFIEISVPLNELSLAVGDAARIQLHVTGTGVTVDTLAHATEASAKNYTLEEVVLPPPPPSRTIALDGSLSDWDPEYIFYNDAEIGDGLPLNSTYSNIYAANDANSLYIGFDVKGTGGGQFSNAWTRSLYIDTDNDPNTGFHGDGAWLVHGYDRYVQWGIGGSSANIYEFTGATQATWGWSYLGPISYGFSDNVVEWGLPRASLGMGTNDEAVLEFAVTGGPIGTNETWAHSTAAAAKTYVFAVAPEPVSKTIVLDGNLSDWGQEYTFYNDGEIVDGLPLNSTYSNIYAANDARFLYCGFDVKGSGGGQFSNDYFRQVYIDSDNNPATGFNSGWMVHGYDRLVEWGVGESTAQINSFAGATQAENAWTYLDTISYGFSDDVVEWGLPRASLGMGTNYQVVLEFAVTGGSVATETWAHMWETSAKTYTFTLAPIIDAMSIAGGMVELGISGLVPGATVTVNRAVTLEPPGWTGTTPFESTGTSTNWSGPLGGSASEFYNVTGDDP